MADSEAYSHISLESQEKVKENKEEVIFEEMMVQDFLN